MRYVLGRADRDAAAARRSRAYIVAGRTVRNILALLASVAVSAVIVGCGTASTSSSAPAAAPRQKPSSSQRVSTVVSVAPACRYKTVNRRRIPPPLTRTNAPPTRSLLSLLRVLRRPATAADRVDLRFFNRWPYEAITLYVRYIRVQSGPGHARIAIMPATICSLPTTLPPPKRVRLVPTDVLLMQVLSNPLPHPTILVGTASDIRNGRANPGLDNVSPPGWLQATVVPDGVARVVMHFTPPFLHHYTAQMTIHDNIGIAIRKPAYSPTSVYLYSADRRLVRKYIDWQALRYDTCLAKHQRNCQ